MRRTITCTSGLSGLPAWLAGGKRKHVLNPRCQAIRMGLMFPKQLASERRSCTA